MTYLIGPERYFSPTPGATADVTVVADVSDSVREFGLEADLTRGVQLDSFPPLFFVAHANGCL